MLREARGKMTKTGSEEFIIQQYRECYESYRQHDRFIWQIPSIAAAIAGGLCAVAFVYVSELYPRLKSIWERSLYRGPLFQK